MSDFLDYDGLQRYHELISKKLPTSAGTAGLVLTSAGSEKTPVWKTGELVHYVTNASGTAGSTATNSYNRTQWIGTCDGVTSLYTGLMVTIKVPVAGVNRGVSLNINNLGEHPVMYNNTMFTTHYGVNTMVPLTYDANATLSIYVNNVNTSFTGCWKCAADYDSTNIYQLRHGSATVTSTTALGRYVLLLQKNENKFVPVTAVNNSVATNKTLTTDSFNPFGDILYYGYTTVINANASPSAAYLYQQIAMDLRYSFNTGTTLTSNKDVYIVATPQADGSAKLYSTPITLTLPSTENGLIYIRLGHAYNTSAVELFPTHPVYWYKNGKIQVYTGLTDTDTNTTYKFTIGSTTKGDSTNGVDLGTLKSETAAANGTTLSLVTTGEKATWNAKTSNSGTVTKVSAGTGLTGGDITTTGTIALATSGVTAGTYKRVTVDAYGRVTSGDNTDTDTNTARLQVSDTTNKRINTKESTGNYIQFTGGTNKFTIGDGTNSFDVAVTPSVSSVAGNTGEVTTTQIASALTDAGYKLTDNNTTYNFSGTSFTSNNSTGVDANAVTYNAHTYYTSNGPATSLGASTNDGALYSQAYSTSWVGQIALDYRNGGLYVRGKNNGTWKSWYKIWDSRNLTNLNLLSNGPGYITGITKAMVTDALGYTPPTTDTNTWRPLGTGANDACAGNDSRLSNARPASDVYSWAKAASKPSYNYSEIGYTANAVTSAGGTLSLNGTIPLHVVTLTGNVSALTLSANPPKGHSCHVILTASSEYTVAIAHDSTNRICPNGVDPNPFTISAGGYIEIDFLNVNNKIYVRGI